MDNGGVFLFGLFAFFFVLWFMGGGPARQISHQGIFITAATTTNSIQEGYGPKPEVNVSVSLPGKGDVSVNSPGMDVKKTNSSAPSVSIARSTIFSSANENQQFLEFTVASHSSSQIHLHNWKFVSKNLQSTAEISTDTILEPGKTLLIVTSFPTTSSHDTMQLVDTDGTIAATASY